MRLPGLLHCRKLGDERNLIAVCNAKGAECIARPDALAQES